MKLKEIIKILINIFFKNKLNNFENKRKYLLEK
jgi:hypothetical protein